MTRHQALALFLTGAILSGLGCSTSKKLPVNPLDGKVDLSGIWEARNTAFGNLEAHSASYGIRAGNSVIVDPADGIIPYKPEALAKRDENFKKRRELDPVNKCYTPGVPRTMYMPYPFQIFQTKDQIEIFSEFAHTKRDIHLTGRGHYDEGEFWIGDSRGKWEGDTLVVDVANFHPDTWLDMSGNHHSAQLHVLERFTRTSDNTMTYEATMTDPEVYTRPWTIRMTLYRNDEPDAQLFEYECHVYLEDEGLKK